MHHELEPNEVSSVDIQINALIDEMGQCIKPLHVKHWFEQQLDHNIELTSVKRDEIQLLQC